jgi:glycosyltransferase involved in cell wall biosynthesis
MPLVSVVIPIHKASDFAEEAIDSILKSDFKDFELLLVLNGAAAEAGIDPLRGDFVKDPRIKMLRSNESGLVPSLNFGVSQAKGSYIARMDFDDFCFPSRLSSQVKYLEDNPQVDVLGAQIELMCEHGASMKRFSKYPRRIRGG